MPQSMGLQNSDTTEQLSNNKGIYQFMVLESSEATCLFLFFFNLFLLLFIFKFLGHTIQHVGSQFPD